MPTKLFHVVTKSAWCQRLWSEASVLALGGVKTDKRDARILSEVSTRIDLPTVHIPSASSRERKTMYSRTQLVSCVRGWLRGRANRPRKGTTHTFPHGVRNLEVEIPDHVERLLIVIEELNEQILGADRELAAIVKSAPLLSRLTSCPGIGPVTVLLPDRG